MNRCPSCETLNLENTDTCTGCGWRFSHHEGKKGGSIIRPATRPKIPCQVQIAFTNDRTASSHAFKTGIPITVDGILSPLEAKAREVSVYFQTHGDLDEGQEMVLLLDGGTPEEARKAAQNISYDGGGDPPEHHLDAIEQLMNTVPWIADPRHARGAIVALMSADSKSTRSRNSASEIGRELKNRGILLYCICEETQQLRELCNAAEGWMFPISNTPNLTELQSIASKVAASITQAAGAPDTAPMTIASDS